MTFVKICGITRPDDARHAVDCGADAIGLVFAAGSPRRIDAAAAAAIAAAVEGRTACVGVFRDQTAEEIDAIRQRVRLELRSQAAGDATLLRCSSPVGMMDLTDDAVVDELYAMQRKLGSVRVCSRPDAVLHTDHITVEGEICFHPDRTGIEDLVVLTRSTALAADRVEETLLGIDSDGSAGLAEGRRDG